MFPEVARNRRARTPTCVAAAELDGGGEVGGVIELERALGLRGVGAARDGRDVGLVGVPKRRRCGAATLARLVIVAAGERVVMRFVMPRPGFVAGASCASP